MSATVAPQDVAKLLAKLGKAAPIAIAKGVRRSTARGVATLVQRNPVDTGNMKASWRSTNGGIDSIAKIENKAPHAGIVENGARPHPVSQEGWMAIYQWARRHFSGSGKSNKDGLDSGLAAITNGIVHKLRTKGQHPTLFVKDSRDDLARFARSEVEKALREELDKVQP